MKNNKSLGQHWLKNRQILDKIAALAVSENPPVTTCLEIGPGLGTLTSSLLKNFEKVIAVEYDSHLARNLPHSFPGKNLEVVNADILKFDLSQIREPYVVAGNIPYYITSPILKHLLTSENLPEKIVLLIQKEVADRILSDKETVLSLFVKNRATVQRGPFVPKSEFTPPPKVDSAVIVLEPKPPLVNDEVFDFIKDNFTAPRKKLIHHLSGSRDELNEIFAALNLDPNARPGDLSLSDWQNLYSKLTD